MLTKKLFYLFIVILVVALGIFGYYSKVSGKESKVFEVVLDTTGFSPSEITVAKGDVIRFSTNLNDPFWPASDPHPLHTDYSVLDPKKPINSGTTWDFKTGRTGEWKYHDHLYPAYRGKITVLGKKEWEARNKILKRDDILKLIDSKGSDGAFAEIKKIDPASIYAHSTFHLFGELLYQKVGEAGISICDSSFGFGCYHGFFIKAVSELGVDAAEKLDKECVKKFGEKGLGCPHGIGHGLVEYLGSGKVNEALQICSELTWQGSLFGCAGGVFMENNFPIDFKEDGVSKSTARNPGKNLFEPCDTVPVRFREACYFEQASWWTQIFKDMTKVGTLCEAVKVPKEREACFLGAGNAISEQTSYNIKEVIEACEQMPGKDSKLTCRTGASWAFFSNPDKRSQSESLCEGLDGEKQCLEKRLLVK